MNDFDELVNGSKPTLVDFYATWCGPCKRQEPILEQVRLAVGNDANVIKVDVDAAPELAGRYHVRSVPTLVIFKNGEAKWRGHGVQQRDGLIGRIREVASSVDYSY